METSATSFLNENFRNHLIFKKLIEYSNFYNSLSECISFNGWISRGTQSLIHIDTYFFLSIKGTLNSIFEILLKGRINDAYTLLRKYYDLVVINIYTNLYVDDNYRLDNLIVTKVNDWIVGKEKIPDFKTMSNYIMDSPKLLTITQLIYADGNFRKSSLDFIRKRCNEHVHYLSYNSLLSNINEIFDSNRLSKLENFFKDLKEIFIMHFAYLFYLNEHYMMSTDYKDFLECNMTPEVGSEYFVAPFFQEMFDNEIKIFRPDIAETIKQNTAMNLK